MTRKTIVIIGVLAVLAPFLHLLTDVLEWINGGFTINQLWINYMAFVMIPFMIMGIYISQLPEIKFYGLIGAVLYAISFIYFAHTTMYAIIERTVNYEILLEKLGFIYYLHGGFMVVGGILFGIAVFKAGKLPKWTSALFLCGLTMNLLLSITDLPAILQTLGSTLRNLGLIAMGYCLIAKDDL